MPCGLGGIQQLGKREIMVKVIDEIGDESQIVLYIEEDLTVDEITNINNSLHAISNIGNINYKSNSMILEEYMDSLGEDAWLFEDLEADTFRNSFVFNIKCFHARGIAKCLYFKCTVGYEFFFCFSKEVFL